MGAVVHVYDDPAAVLAMRLVSLLRGREQAAIAVSGGSTPRRLFRLLATAHRNAIAWDKLAIFQVDERCVPPEDDQSNWKMLNEELLSKVPDVKAFRLEAERDGAAEDYEAVLRREISATNDAGVPILDVVLLGMGPDGHTASLFPKTAALTEEERLMLRNEVPQLDTHRVTMTYPLLKAAEHRWFLVRGADKAEAFAKARNGELPAGALGSVEWFVDASVAQAKDSRKDNKTRK